MVNVSLNNYILDLMRNNRSNETEIFIRPKNENFNVYRIYAETEHLERIPYIAAEDTLLFCSQGQATFSIRSSSLDLKEGNIVFLSRDATYNLEMREPSTVLLKIKLNADPKFRWEEKVDKSKFDNPEERRLIQKYIENMKGQHHIIFKNTSVMWSSEIVQALLSEYIKGGLFETELAPRYLDLILYSSLRTRGLSLDEETGDGNFGDRLLDEYIDIHYNDISLAKTAKYFGFNKNYFSSLVKEKTGKSFVDHVDERRMIEAKRLLGQPDISLYEVVERVGYSSKSFFYKKFNNYYGMTPAAMRKKLFKEAGVNLR